MFSRISFSFGILFCFLLAANSQCGPSTKSKQATANKDTAAKSNSDSAKNAPSFKSKPDIPIHGLNAIAPPRPPPDSAVPKAVEVRDVELAVQPVLEINKIILSTLSEFPKGGGYSVSRKALNALAQAISYDPKVDQFLVTPNKCIPSFCSGATYLVLLKTLQTLSEERKLALTPEAWKAYSETGNSDGDGLWGRWNANGPGTAKLFHDLQAGMSFSSLDRALPGDFMKIWWNMEIGAKESGHSVIYLGCSTENGEEMIRFWSSNIPNGFGEKKIPRTKAKRLLFSRLTRPENLAKSAKLPRHDKFLASMLNRSYLWEDIVAECGVIDSRQQIDLKEIVAPKAVQVEEK